MRAVGVRYINCGWLMTSAVYVPIIAAIRIITVEKQIDGWPLLLLMEA